MHRLLSVYHTQKRAWTTSQLPLPTTYPPTYRLGNCCCSVPTQEMDPSGLLKREMLVCYELFEIADSSCRCHGEGPCHSSITLFRALLSASVNCFHGELELASAPETLLLIVDESGMAFLDRRLKRCIGWDCLSAAEKSGIIFSISFASVVFFLIYMHCLGKAAISRRERRSVRLPGGRRVSRRSFGPDGGVIAQLPVVWHWPGNQARVIYQPALFNVEGQNPPRAQPVAFAEHHSLSSPGTRHQQMPGGSMYAATQATLSPLPASPRPPEQPTWRQRLNRAMRLPVGRASTIASESVADVAEQAAHTDPADGTESHNRDLPEGRDDDSCEMRSNAATVHSDDFRTAVPTPRLQRRDDRDDSTEVASVRDQTTADELTNADVDQIERRDNEGKNGADELHKGFWIPSVSSFQLYEQGHHN
ncbi:hypothetical protein L249_6213 [Ophiocordyceps polyrhachis-furcata BCC 54312]|uniref:Uncharacterized protein n=1 Tax=Ophiocordyceps polyrhachis-furcata BCC 54312 TaxID=1330021 RepID=A0A367L0X5_9HYPO|nr:hypothetical protein L249_6213 [Ophiocordyceps polyrhachis-furcata BCC 54312]